MNKQDQVKVGISRVINEDTWDLLEALSTNDVNLDIIISHLVEFEAFSNKQEEILQEFCKDALDCGMVIMPDNPNRIDQEYEINWTDVLFALYKTQKHLFDLYSTPLYI